VRSCGRGDSRRSWPCFRGRNRGFRHWHSGSAANTELGSRIDFVTTLVAHGDSRRRRGNRRRCRPRNRWISGQSTFQPGKMLAQSTQLGLYESEFLACFVRITTAPPLYDKGIDQRPYGDDEYKPTEIFHRQVLRVQGMWAEL
jgi:hypothetical protein